MEKEVSKISRREFLTATIAVLASAGIGSTTFLILSEKYRKPKSIYPERNPAFAWYVMDDLSVRCYTNTEGSIKAYQMNPIGGKIWQECDGSQKIEDISNKVANSFSLDPKFCLKETRRFIALLEQYNFILSGGEIAVVRSIWEKGA